MRGRYDKWDNNSPQININIALYKTGNHEQSNKHLVFLKAEEFIEQLNGN